MNTQIFYSTCEELLRVHPEYQHLLEDLRPTQNKFDSINKEVIKQLLRDGQPANDTCQCCESERETIIKPSYGGSFWSCLKYGMRRAYPVGHTPQVRLCFVCSTLISIANAFSTHCEKGEPVSPDLARFLDVVVANLIDRIKQGEFDEVLTKCAR